MTLDCPQGFVIPDDPNSSGNVYINRNISECALSCRHPPIFTSSELSSFETTELSSAVAGAVLSSLVVVLWFNDDAKRKRFFVITYGIGIICALIFLAVAGSFGSARYCLNNANSIDATNTSEGISLCTMESATLIFVVISCAAFFCMQSFEVFRKLVMGWKAPVLPWLQGFIVLGIPLVCSITGLAARFYGSDIGTPICTNNHNSIPAMLVSVIPVALLTFFGLIFSISITVKTLWLVVEGNSVWDTLRLVSTPVHFIVFTGLYLVGLLAMRLALFEGSPQRLKIMLDWGACALAHFDGTTESYVASCGSRPELKADIIFWYIAGFVIRGGFGFCFFMVNIHGVLAELGKYFCPSHVQPAPYIELAPVSLNSSAAVPDSVHMSIFGHENMPVYLHPRYESLGESQGPTSSEDKQAIMARINADQDSFIVIAIEREQTVISDEAVQV